MSRRIQLKRGFMLVAPVGLVGLFACFNAPVEKPLPKITQESDVRVEQNIKNKVDILFVIDDSPSMTPKQQQLRQRFPDLIKILEDFGKANPASYHIGVVTSDLGAGQFTLGQGQCHPGGRGGKLQALGAAADTTCQPPGNGLNFIDFNQLTGTNNLPPGQDLATTFGCMAAVGDKGCGFEQQLEAAYTALHSPPAENHDFLRQDALLVVVWVTDEDDCSADPNTDLFDPSKTGVPPSGYGALLSYRCSEFGIACVDPADGQMKPLPYGDSAGTWTGCMSLPPASGGKLTDIQKYMNLFKNGTGNGGLKADANDVILVGITAPSSQGASSILANPTAVGPYQQCPGPISQTCAVVLQHSCVASTDTNFFGDPAVRINQVIGSVTHNQQTSICDTSYQSALQNLGQLIVSQIGAGCITSPFEDPQNPDCVVEDVSTDGTNTQIKEIPKCDATGKAPIPCWRLDSKPVCVAGQNVAGCCDTICAKDGDPGQHYGITIERGPAGPPANTTARVACSTIAVPKDPQTGNLPMCGAPLP